MAKKRNRKKSRQRRRQQVQKAKQYKLGKPSQVPTNDISFEPPEVISLSPSLFDETVVLNWYKALDVFQNARFYAPLKALGNELLRTLGTSGFAETIQKAESLGAILDYEVAYNDTMYNNYVNAILQSVPDSGVFYQEEMMDKYEFRTNMIKAFEESEDWQEPS